jgi:hypothetical protein
MCPNAGSALTSEGSADAYTPLTSEGSPVGETALTSESVGHPATPLTSERGAALELHRGIVGALAGRPRRRQNRTVTDEERAEWANQRETWAREREAKATQARSDLLAALDSREQAERAVEDALLAALKVNKAETLIGLMGKSQATFWRIVKRARYRTGQKDEG